MEILAIIVAIIFGIPAYFFLFRKKTKLYFIKIKQINLQDDLLKNFDNLTIKYNDVEINDKITFVKGHILCSGDRDITGKSNKIIISANETTWLDFKITAASKDLKVDFVVTSQKVIIEFGLLKNGESFEFEGIINHEIKNKEVLLEFFHRIPNIPKVETVFPLVSKLVLSLLGLGMIYVLSGIFMFYTELNKIEAWDIHIFDSKTHKVIPSYKFSDSFYTKVNDVYPFGIELFFNKSKNFKVTYSIKNEKKRMRHEKSIYFKRIKNFKFTFFIISIIIILLGLVMTIFGLNKLSQRKYLKKLRIT